MGNAAGQGLSIAGRQIFSGLGLPFPFVVFLGNTVGTVLITWMLMPAACRLFDWWLSPSSTRAQTIRGILLLGTLYAAEI
ncbi:MAG: hypothetical protein PSV46_01445 [Reyranella sp.]|nr:hypothetical protein [Reyranella sp.]